MTREQLLQRIEKAWLAFQESYAGLTEAQMVEPGVVESWSVKDVLAHVTTWEEEALRYLPVILAGGRPPRYATVGGIDAFNARKIEEKRALPLAEVLRQLDETHQGLIAYIGTVPDDQVTRETRFRRRLRWDTYSHYPIHAASIVDWRRDSE